MNFWKRRLYVKIQPDELLVRDVWAGIECREPPLLALSHAHPEMRSIVAFGKAAELLQGKGGVSVHNPFSHPRTPLSDFTVAEQVVKHFVEKVCPSRFYLPAPEIVMHLAVKLEGGVTQIEDRALRELAIGAGARSVIAWYDATLSDDEVKSLKI